MPDTRKVSRLRASRFGETTVRRDLLFRPDPAPERAGRRLVVVPGVGRPVADLRRDADRQFRARLALHAGPLHRLQPDRGAGSHAARLLERGDPGGVRRRPGRDRHRGADPAPHLSRARAVPAARHLRRRPRHQGCRALRLGLGGSGGSARARSQRRGRDPGQAHPELRPAADRDRAAGAAGHDGAAEPHALGRAGAGGDPGPRHGGGAGRRPGQAVHLGVLRRRRAGGAGRGAADPARAGQSRPRSHRHRRCLRGHCRRRPGQPGRGVSRRHPDRRRQGVLYRLGRFQAHPGGRVRDHGRGAGAAALRPLRQAALDAARRRRRASRRSAPRAGRSPRRGSRSSCWCR